MLGLKAEGFYLPFLMIVGGRKGVETSTLKIALVIDVTPKEVEYPLNRTGVREERETVLEKTERELKQHRFDPSPVPVHK